MKEDLKRFLLIVLIVVPSAVAARALGWFETRDDFLDARGVAVAVIAVVVGLLLALRVLRRR